MRGYSYYHDALVQFTMIAIILSGLVSGCAPIASNSNGTIPVVPGAVEVLQEGSTRMGITRAVQALPGTTALIKDNNLVLGWVQQNARWGFACINCPEGENALSFFNRMTGGKGNVTDTGTFTDFVKWLTTTQGWRIATSAELTEFSTMVWDFIRAPKVIFFVTPGMINDIPSGNEL